MKRLCVLASLLVLTVALAGCGSGKKPTSTTGTSDHATSKAAAGESGPGHYRWSRGGFTVTVDAPATTGNADVQAIEAFRTEVGGAQVAYLTVALDNTSGQQQVELSDITVVTGAGEQIEFHPAWHDIGDWQEAIDINSNETAYNQGTDLYNRFLNRDSTLPGAKAETIYTGGTRSLDSIKSIYLNGSINNETITNERLTKA